MGCLISYAYVLDLAWRCFFVNFRLCNLDKMPIHVLVFSMGRGARCASGPILCWKWWSDCLILVSPLGHVGCCCVVKNNALTFVCILLVGVRRVFIVEAGSKRVEGIISLSDIFKFLLSLWEEHGCFVVTSAGVLTVANSMCEASRHAMPWMNGSLFLNLSVLCWIEVRRD